MSRKLPDLELIMSNYRLLYMEIRLKYRKKLRSGRENSMNLRDSTKKLIITMIKIRHYGKVNSSSLNNRETQPNVTSRMLNVNSNPLLNLFKNLKARIKTSVNHLIQ